MHTRAPSPCAEFGACGLLPRLSRCKPDAERTRQATDTRVTFFPQSSTELRVRTRCTTGRTHVTRTWAVRASAPGQRTPFSLTMFTFLCTNPARDPGVRPSDHRHNRVKRRGQPRRARLEDCPARRPHAPTRPHTRSRRDLADPAAHGARARARARPRCAPARAGGENPPPAQRATLCSGGCAPRRGRARAMSRKWVPRTARRGPCPASTRRRTVPWDAHARPADSSLLLSAPTPRGQGARPWSPAAGPCQGGVAGRSRGPGAGGATKAQATRTSNFASASGGCATLAGLSANALRGPASGHAARGCRPTKKERKKEN